ncbi:hypothetical protein [Terrabacter sp. 2RAF25]|uniref:hypothetical protein n=1 Tax=Terrabacter sp. 2RAF25 TaxID=3232998 RepID=UPI003F985F87
MFSKGADVDALRDSAWRMASFGNEIDVVRARGQRAVSTMQRAWQGPDLQHLVERWRRVEHDLARISADFDRLSRRLHDNADLQHRSSGRPSGASVHTSSHTPGHSSGHVSGHSSGHAVGHAAFGHVVEQAAVGHGGGGRPQSLWAGHVGASVVAAAGTPQVHTAMGWAQWIGAGQAFELQHGVPDGWFHPAPSATAAATAAHELGLPIR